MTMAKALSSRATGLILVTILSVVLAFCFTGCSGSTGSTTGNSTGTAASETSEGGNAKTDSTSGDKATSQVGMRTVETDKGPVEIPENPQTIVSDYYLGEMLAVDVKPAIASPYALNNPFLADYVDGIEALNTTSAETSLEMIAETQPDLIITITEADYDKYSKIAPTVYI